VIKKTATYEKLSYNDSVRNLSIVSQGLIIVLQLKATSRLISLIVLTVMVAACGSAQPTQPIYQRVTDAKLKASDAIPKPTGDTILTVSGKIGAANDGDKIVMDLATLESAGLVDYKVTDPFDNVDVTFRGVLMTDLLTLWKADPNATTLVMTALNDYSVDIPMSDFKQYPVIFALQQDGKYMPVATRGPAMLVYPYNHFQFDKEKYNDRWIWQLKSIEVK
jgi:hypothetical protein